MALDNATLLRIDLPGPPDAAGQRAYTEGDSIEYRCRLGKVTRSQRFNLEATIADSDEVAYIFLRVFPGATALVAGQRLLLELDGFAAALRLVVATNPQIKTGGLSHVEVYLKGGG